MDRKPHFHWIRKLIPTCFLHLWLHFVYCISGTLPYLLFSCFVSYVTGTVSLRSRTTAIYVRNVVSCKTKPTGKAYKSMFYLNTILLLLGQHSSHVICHRSSGWHSPTWRKRKRGQKSRGKNYFIGRGKGKDKQIEVALSTWWPFLLMHISSPISLHWKVQEVKGKRTRRRRMGARRNMPCDL